MSAVLDFLRGVWVLATAIVFRCWSVLAMAGVVSLVLLHGQGFETVLADLAAAGEAKGTRLLWSSALLAVIVFMSSNVLLGRWDPQSDARHAAFARYTGPLVLSVLATWVIPACLVSTKGLGTEEFDSLKFGFIVALVGGIAAMTSGSITAKTVFRWAGCLRRRPSGGWTTASRNGPSRGAPAH